MKKPYNYQTVFAANVIKAYRRGELTFDNIDEWNKEYNGGTAPNPAFNTREILEYYCYNNRRSA